MDARDYEITDEDVVSALVDSCASEQRLRARIADLARRLAEAQGRAGLFDGLPEPTSLEAGWLSRRDVVAHLSMQVNTGWFWRVTTVAGQKSGPGTLAECLAALRRELEVDRGE